MNEFTLREYQAGDIPELKSLWRRVFGDPDIIIDAFFELLPDIGTAVTAHVGTTLIGAAYAITGMELVKPGYPAETCGYIYAVAVNPEYRKLGAGGALVRASVSLAQSRGASIISTLPAEDSLYGWYRELLGFERVLYRQRRERLSAPLEPTLRISTTEYMLWREQLLSGSCHIRLSYPALEFARRFYEGLGGGLYACGDGICAAYAENGVALIRELIVPDQSELESVAASVGAALGAKSTVLFLPAPDGEPYIAALPGVIPSDCIWNLSFD